jgi:hypothetical protein
MKRRTGAQNLRSASQSGGSILLPLPHARQAESMRELEAPATLAFCHLGRRFGANPFVVTP